MTKRFLRLIASIFFTASLILLVGCNQVENKKEKVVVSEENTIKIGEAEKDSNIEYVEASSGFESSEDFILKDIDGSDNSFEFEYKGEKILAKFSYGSWRIIDSYKITNTKDMKIICEALIAIHPVHGSDGKSYRTAEDMVYEWVQHNIAYHILPDGNAWKNNAKNVDLDPEDQGKSLKEMFKSRTGKEISLNDIK